MSVEPEDVGCWAIMVGAILLGALMVAAFVICGVVAIRERMAVSHCRLNGGIVEHYNAKDDTDWRCVGATAERP